MNLLIDLIIKIFQAIFEEDSLNRPKKPVRHSHPRQREPQSQGYNRAAQSDYQRTRPQYALDQPRADSQVEKGQSFSEFHRQLHSLDTPPPLRSQPRQKHKAKRHRPEEPQQTLAQHIANQEAYQSALEERSHEVENHTRDHLGLASSDPLAQGTQGMRLPGVTPLEQMVFAGVILGPCKAHQRRRVL